MSPEPLKLFYCYAHADTKLRKRLDDHLALLKREGVISEWHDGDISAGYAALLSCRKSFFDGYLTTTPLKELFHHISELQPASINANVIQYIRSVCKRQQTPAADRIINAIQMSKELQELAQRPLLLLMILEIFTSARDINEERWSATRLYRKYTDTKLRSVVSIFNDPLP